MWLKWAMPVTSTPGNNVRFKKLFWKQEETIAQNQISQKQRIRFVYVPLFPMELKSYSWGGNAGFQMILRRCCCFSHAWTGVLCCQLYKWRWYFKMLQLSPSLVLNSWCFYSSAIQVVITLWRCCSFFHLWCGIAGGAIQVDGPALDAQSSVGGLDPTNKLGTNIIWG